MYAEITSIHMAKYLLMLCLIRLTNLLKALLFQKGNTLYSSTELMKRKLIAIKLSSKIIYTFNFVWQTPCDSLFFITINQVLLFQLFSYGKGYFPLW